MTLKLPLIGSASVWTLRGFSLLSVSLLLAACLGRSEGDDQPGAAGESPVDSGGEATDPGAAGNGAGRSTGGAVGHGGTTGGHRPDTDGGTTAEGGTSSGRGSAAEGGLADAGGTAGRGSAAEGGTAEAGATAEGGTTADHSAGTAGRGLGGSDTAGVAGAAGQGDSGGGGISGGCGITVSGPARWELVAPMAEARTQHSATLLKGGKVLVVGGVTGEVWTGHDIASAELYDPCANTWSSAGSLAEARNGHSAVVLRDGRVLVVGGVRDGWSVVSAEIYDPESNVWSPTGVPPGPGRAILLKSGQVLLIGSDVVDNTTALYDVASGTWSPTGVMAHPRWGWEVTLLSGGKVLVSGGFSLEPFTPAVLEAESYDPASEAWSPAGWLSRMRNGHAPVRLPSGRVLISGGYPQAPSPTVPASTEIYDSVKNSWSAGNDLLEARWIHTTTLLHDDRVLLAAGAGQDFALSSAELYDEESGEFSPTASLHVARWSHTATLLPDSRVLVIGGNDGSVFLDSVEMYTPETATP
jgi:hypothetical protein